MGIGQKDASSKVQSIFIDRVDYPSSVEEEPLKIESINNSNEIFAKVGITSFIS